MFQDNALGYTLCEPQGLAQLEMYLNQTDKSTCNEITTAMEKLEKETTDIPTLMEMALKEMVSHEKRLNDVADPSEDTVNLLSQFAKATGIIYLHSWKVGVELVGTAYGRGILMSKSDAGWSLPIAIQEPEVKLGLQAAAVEEDQIILILDDKNTKEFATGKHPSLVVGIDAFLAFSDKGGAVETDNTNVGDGSTLDFDTFRDFPEANTLFYGEDYDKSRILQVSPRMDESDLVKGLRDKSDCIKEFITILEGFQQAAQMHERVPKIYPDLF